MPTLFADSWYYIELLDRRSASHTQAVEYLKGRRARIVTTAWVLTEVAAHFSRAKTRHLFVGLTELLNNDADTVVVPANADLFNLGTTMYRDRPDKDWSLVDCISFVIMGRQALYEALTADHHFRQAGFVPLFT